MAWNKTITQQGLNELANLNNNTITFSSAKCGRDFVTTELKDVTTMNNAIKNMDFISIQTINDLLCIKLKVNNSGVTEDSDIYQVGIFATNKNGNDFLFAIFQTDIPTTIPKNTTSNWEKEYDLYLKFSSVDISTINIEADTQEIEYATEQDILNLF